MTRRLTATPATEVREKDLQAAVRSLARQLGWRDHVQWTAIHSPRGWPDLTLYRQRPDGTGEMVAIEFKSERGKTTPEQDWWLDALRTVPGFKWVGVIRPSDWFAGALDEVLR